jgi:hypothetical protein
MAPYPSMSLTELSNMFMVGIKTETTLFLQKICPAMTLPIHNYTAALYFRERLLEPGEFWSWLGS